MSVRLEEIHPILVHYPLALLPVAIGADLLASVTGSDRLADVGRVLMPIAAAGAAVAAVTGLIAQEEVQADADAEAHAMLVTHRNVNVGLVTLATGLAIWRGGRRSAGPGYLALGLAGLGAMAYSAYLGGKMVYDHGLGVRPGAPEITPGTANTMARRAGRDIAQGATHAFEDLRAGDVLPALG